MIQGRPISPLVALALSAWLIASSAFASDDPANVIKALYQAHQPWAGRELNRSDPKTLSRYFGKELTNLFVRNAETVKACPAGDLCGVGFDPILAAQDFDDHLQFSLRVEEQLPSGTHLYAAHFKLFNDAETEQIVVFQLTQSEAGWRITDIIYPDQGNASLKAMLIANH